MKRLIQGMLGILVLSTSAAGCMSATASFTRHLARSQAALTAARAVPNSTLDTVKSHLQAAEQQLEEAQALAKAGNLQRADYLLGRAEADVDLAVSLAKGGQEPEQK